MGGVDIHVHLLTSGMTTCASVQFISPLPVCLGGRGGLLVCLPFVCPSFLYIKKLGDKRTLFGWFWQVYGGYTGTVGNGVFLTKRQPWMTVMWRASSSATWGSNIDFESVHCEYHHIKIWLKFMAHSFSTMARIGFANWSLQSSRKTFYATGLKGSPRASKDWIVHQSVRPFVRNSVPLTNIVWYLKFGLS